MNDDHSFYPGDLVTVTNEFTNAWNPDTGKWAVTLRRGDVCIVQQMMKLLRPYSISKFPEVPCVIVITPVGSVVSIESSCLTHDIDAMIAKSIRKGYTHCKPA